MSEKPINVFMLYYKPRNLRKPRKSTYTWENVFIPNTKEFMYRDYSITKSRKIVNKKPRKVIRGRNMAGGINIRRK